MRITLNLASRPHIDLRPYLQRLRLWMALLLVLAFALWSLLRTQAIKAADAQSEQKLLQQQANQLHKEQQGFHTLMREPQNAEVLQQSEFLNQLFRQKSFSWTAVMMDLENVLPAGVQVSSIEPILSTTGKVSIRLRVQGPRDKSVDLIRNLEHSKRFVGPYLSGETAETNGLNGNGPAMMQTVSASNQVTFDILAEYNPVLKSEKSEEAKATKAETPTKAASTKSAPTPRPKKRGSR